MTPPLSHWPGRRHRKTGERGEQDPHYLAALLDSSDLERDLLLAVSHARSDEEAISLAKKHGTEWLTRNGIG